MLEFLNTFLIFVLLALVITLSIAFFLLEFFIFFTLVFKKKAREPRPPLKRAPFVSLHIPIANEPPETVKETLRSIARMRYPNFEVLVIDNNTQDEAVWRPVQKEIARLGRRFRFFHKDYMPGAKAEALNFAYFHTNPKAEIVGIIDSDYHVDPDFLKRTVPYFMDPTVALVQTPQGWRGFAQNEFLRSVHLVYRWFFSLIMEAAQRYNAASFMGTMGLIRKNIIEEIGGWNIRYLTEDIEIGIRVHKAGYKSHYLNQEFGQGLMPFEFATFRNQRIRWIFGNAQVLKDSIGDFLSFTNRHLTPAQKICYLAALTAWFNNLFFPSFLLLGAGILYLAGGPLFTMNSVFWWALAFPVFVFFFAKAVGYCILQRREQARWLHIAEAFLVFLSLSWIMSFVWLYALFSSSRQDYRKTPKAHSGTTSFMRRFWPLREEFGMGLTTLVLAVALLYYSAAPWMLVLPLFLLACFYLAPLWGVARFPKHRDADD